MTLQSIGMSYFKNTCEDPLISLVSFYIETITLIVVESFANIPGYRPISLVKTVNPLIIIIMISIRSILQGLNALTC